MLHDLLILGAGPAGSAAAILLARQGLSVALCEQKTFPREKVCGEFMGPRARPLLASLGLLPEYDALAGPEIRRVHIHAGKRTLTAPLPPDQERHHGRALSRAAFDLLLLTHARAAGAEIHQPCHVRSITGSLAAGFTISTDAQTLHAKTIALAHGLAQRGDLSPTPPPPKRTGYPERSGFLCFKTHFTSPNLPPDAIAIGGAKGLYAGLVHSSSNRACLALVVHRARLAALGPSPDAHLTQLLRHNAGFAKMLAPATQCSPWLASGPLLPGVRSLYHDGRFFLGNAAGEVHALIGEGMTLAMNSAHLLATAIQRHGLTDSAGLAYKKSWPPTFRRRHHPAKLFATLMMSPPAATTAAALLRTFPSLLPPLVRAAGK